MNKSGRWGCNNPSVLLRFRSREKVESEPGTTSNGPSGACEWDISGGDGREDVDGGNGIGVEEVDWVDTEGVLEDLLKTRSRRLNLNLGPVFPVAGDS